MRHRQKMNRGSSRKLFRKTARPIRKNNMKKHGLKRGGIRL
jgi:hypothetical protein